MGPDLLTLDLNDADFALISTMVYEACGIHLPSAKAGLVKARLTKRLRSLEIPDFKDYLDFVRSDHSGREMAAMIDVLTTNKTFFFRESQHFDFVRDTVLPSLSGRERIRFWSAGCSSGEEPYTLAMVLREAMPDIDRRDVRILATDISSTMVCRAREGVYDDERAQEVPAELRHRYFQAIPGAGAWRVRPELQRLVSVGRLNLMDPWPMQGPFDAIFCRNVMIYFDRPTQHRLIERFSQMLRPGGYLFVGHSESLSTWSNTLRYVRPAVYAR